MSNELTEKIDTLTSRINNMLSEQPNLSRQKLLEEQDRLAKLQMLLISQSLREEGEQYKMALQGLNEAIACVNVADGKIENVAKAVTLVAKAGDLIAKLIGKALG